MDVVEWPAVEKSLDTDGKGLTLHFMDSGLDTGDILLQKKLQLRIDDTFRSIRTRLESMMADLVLEGIHSIMDNKITPIEQKPEEGKQYFVMHPRMQAYAGHQLNNYLEQLDKR